MAKNYFQYGGCNSYTLQCGIGASWLFWLLRLINTLTYLLTYLCGSGIVSVNLPSGSTLQCDTWLWNDMPLNSPERPPYWNSTSGFHFHTSPQSTCHSGVTENAGQENAGLENEGQKVKGVEKDGRVLSDVTAVVAWSGCCCCCCCCCSSSSYSSSSPLLCQRCPYEPLGCGLLTSETACAYRKPRSLVIVW